MLNTFFTLFASMLPIYACIFFGTFSTAFLKCDKTSIAKILLYLLSPLVVFNSALSVKLNLQIIFLPITLFLISVFMCFFVYFFLRKMFHKSEANLLAFATSVGNSAYLGIALALIFLPPNLIEVFIFTILAAIFYQYSVGFSMAANGANSFKTSLIKMIKLPVLHAFFLGIILNLMDFSMPKSLGLIFDNAKGALSILGMMIIGMNLEKIHKQNVFDAKFISISCFLKLIVHPLIMCVFIFLDAKFFAFFNKDLYIIFFILSIVPLAGNAVIIATILKINSEKMALSVFISTIISLFSIPLMMIFFDFFIRNL